MELFSTQFFTGLAAIIVIDLMLAGDNAIVIALAARRLPPQLQKRAVVWGMVGAVAVRSAMTLIVVWLLQVPGLLLVGGLALIWIAYRLLLPEPDVSHEGGEAPTTFWAAMRTIVIADAVMGLDNVLAVAGAAHGNYLLVVLGLLISIPIVVWGSQLLLRWVERFPAIVYLGAAVLGWTAAKMIASEPFAASVFTAYPVLVPLLYMTIVGGVLWAGFVKNHRHLESRISARLEAFERSQAFERNAAPSANGEGKHRILVPINGSRNDAHAMRQLANEFAHDPTLEVHLLNVRTPLRTDVSQFLRRDLRDDFYEDEARKVLKNACEALEKHRIPYSTHIRIGDKGEAIVEEARRLECARILMSTARKNSLTRMLEDSTTEKVLARTTVPVEIVAGDKVSRLEEIGWPAGVAVAIAIFVVAAIY